MDLVQSKLTRSEWNSIEIQIKGTELNILKMISKGHSNPDIIDNDNVTLAYFLKINVEDNPSIEYYLFETYFLKDILKITKEFCPQYKPPEKSKKISKINTPDMVRLNQNSYETIIENKDLILEYIYLTLIKKFFKYKKKGENTRWMLYYYTFYTMNKSISKLNNQVKHFINYVIQENISLISIPKLISKFNNYIEKNEFIYKHADRKLYSHQKEIFRIFNRKNPYEPYENTPRLILYIAPTSTGKTLTPIGLSEQYRVIFVCAARHVGINLAKSAISAGKKVAFAFGIQDSSEIRLHYNAGSSFIKHEYDPNTKRCSCRRPKCDKEGQPIKYKDGKLKIDNTDGSKVEIMICDIKSYIHAMYYMKSFNQNPNGDSLSDINTRQTSKSSPYYPIITFWDEPTITMDYETHSFHDVISKNWKENTINNMILSSATLPKEHEIQSAINSFKNNFGENTQVRSVISHDCKKTIPIVNSSGHIIVPHVMYENYRDLITSIDFIKNNHTLLRYFDLNEIANFIMYANEKKIIINDSLILENVFPHIDSISVQSIKEYYLEILENIDDEMWPEVYEYFNKKNEPVLEKGGVLITSDHAASLVDGPTIFITEEPEKIAKFYLAQAKIPKEQVKNINNCIDFNNTINKKIIELEKELQDKLEKYEMISDSKVGNIEKNDPEIRELMKNIDRYNENIKTVNLPELYIPNRKKHIERFHKIEELKGTPFTSLINEDDVEKIMAINDIDDIWKILLIMGIGLFSQTNNITYTEIVKELAEKQKLYLIIAKGDYIYGTNYQFCHGFLSKDLTNMTQEKIIQAIGRIGRNDIQKHYSVRFRNDEMIHRLFNVEEDKVESRIMNELFC